MFLCFVPAFVEICAYVLFGMLLLNMAAVDAAILGCVMAAVSPAVIVPRMLKLKEQGYGKDKGIPDMIMAGASVDDVFVIVLFTALTAMAGGGNFSFAIIWQVPVSIVLGIAAGGAIGFLFSVFVKKFHLRDSVKVILLLCFSCLFVALQNAVGDVVPFSGLLAVITMGAMLFAVHGECASRLSSKFSKLWVFAEICLFVLVGAEADIRYAFDNIGLMVGVIALCLLVCMVGVWLSVCVSGLNLKEKLFCSIAYTPKATVQAAIGGIPLAMGLACGQTVLTAAVLAILITAPVGAFAIDLTYKKLLSRPKILSEENLSEIKENPCGESVDNQKE